MKLFDINIKFPKTFRPKKNLNGKTKKLVEEAKKMPKEPKRIQIAKSISQRELRDIITLRDRYRALPHGMKINRSLHEEVDALMEKAGYVYNKTSRYRISQKAYEYHIRPSLSYRARDIIIRRYAGVYWPDIGERYALAEYRFATVHEFKIEKFSKTFERYDRGGLAKLLTLATRDSVKKHTIRFIDDDREALIAGFGAI